MEELAMTKPDDWHLHLRDGDLLRAVLPHSAKHFGRAIVMPNLKPLITTTTMAVAYRESILNVLPPGSGFDPLMTLYLTDKYKRRRDQTRQQLITKTKLSYHSTRCLSMKHGRKVWEEVQMVGLLSTIRGWGQAHRKKETAMLQFSRNFGLIIAYFG